MVLPITRTHWTTVRLRRTDRSRITTSIVRPDGGCGFPNTRCYKGDELHVEVHVCHFGPGHVLAVVTVLMFAGNKLPGASRSLGKSLRLFKSELRQLHTEDKADEPAAPPTPVRVGRITTPAD